jgi:hypothetical protein
VTVRAIGAVRNHRLTRLETELGHRIAARFEEHEDVLAICDPGSAEADAQAPAQRLGVQESLRQRFGHEEPADGSR